jgi:hypothetical protein
VVIARELALIRSLERDSVLLIARFAREKRKILSPIPTRNVLFARAAAEIRVTNYLIRFVKERDMLPNIRQMSMQNLIDDVHRAVSEVLQKIA